jgi:hypothetical protein
MAPDTVHPGAIGDKSSQTIGAPSNAPLGKTPQQCRHQVFRRVAAIVATENMTQEAHLKNIRKTGSSKNIQQHAIGCELIHICVDDGQLTISPAAGVHGELRNHVIASHNSLPPWSTKAFLRTVHKIEHHDIVSSGIIPDELSEKYPREWTKQALKTLEEAMESYMVEVIPESVFGSSNYFLRGFHHVSYYGKTRRSGTA